MKKEISISLAGMGGQGIVFATTALAEALFKQGYYVSQLQSYGAEVRGGAVIGWVVYSESPVECPFTDEFDVLVLLHDIGYKESVKKGLRGKIVIADSDLVSSPPVEAIKVPMSREAETKGYVGSTSIVALGLLVAMGYVDDKALEEVLQHMKRAEINIKALRLGRELAQFISVK